jgi:adenylate cyclase class 2
MSARRFVTNLEIEVKLPVVNLPEMIRKLNRLGASCGGRVFERNTLYDTRMSDLRRCGRLLRLRTQTPARTALLPGGPRQALITCKAPAPPRPSGQRRRSDFKEKAERELPIGSPGQWPSILRSLGLFPSFRYEKFRTSFHLRGLHLDLDETPVGAFLELEGNPRKIHRTAMALGFSRRHYLRSTYWDLYVAACRKRGRVPQNMLFDR